MKFELKCDFAQVNMSSITGTASYSAIIPRDNSVLFYGYQFDALNAYGNVKLL